MFRYVPEINMFLCLPFQNDNKTKHQSQGSNDKVFRLQKLAVAKPAEAFCEWSSDFYMCKTFPQGLIKMSCHTVLHTRILSKSFNGCQFCLFQSPLKQCSMTYYQLRSEETNVHIVIYYALFVCFLFHQSHYHTITTFCYYHEERHQCNYFPYRKEVPSIICAPTEMTLLVLKHNLNNLILLPNVFF